MTNSALVIIDMQEFFFVENPDVDRNELGKRCNEIAETSRAANIPVVHVLTTYRDDKVDWPRAWTNDDSWCANLVLGRESAQLVDQLSVDPGDFIVEKKRFSSFYNTNLDDILRSLGCDHIYLAGYSADVCVRFTAVDAYNRGYRVSLIYEGIESFREPKDASITYLDWLIDADCLSIAEFQKAAIGSAGQQ